MATIIEEMIVMKRNLYAIRVMELYCVKPLIITEWTTKPKLIGAAIASPKNGLRYDWTTMVMSVQTIVGSWQLLEVTEMITSFHKWTYLALFKFFAPVKGYKMIFQNQFSLISFNSFHYHLLELCNSIKPSKNLVLCLWNRLL